jgi:LysM repeat protein
VQEGDTLEAIARKYLGDGSLAGFMADFNGLRNPDLLFPGQVLQLPGRQELTPGGHGAPHGLQGILDEFGRIYDYLRQDGSLDPAWESKHMARVALPFPLTLSWDTSRRVNAFVAHRKLSGKFTAVLREIQQNGLASALHTFGGCYSYRTQRGNSKLSTHAWGIAIDLNPETNQRGTPGDMHPEVAALFKAHGFAWGGDWTGRARDPMHFQYCTGY